MIRRWFKSGDPWIWLIGGAVSVSVIMVVGLLLLIGVRGLGHFWQPAIVEATVTITDASGEVNQRNILGTIRTQETVSAQSVRESGIEVAPGQNFVDRYLFKVGNRDLTGQDFEWFVADNLSAFRYPENAIQLQRREWGDFFGY